MLISIVALREEYNLIKRNSSYGTVSVLIFIPYTVDSISSFSILIELFRRDDILANYMFINSYSDIQNDINNRQEDETIPPIIIFINCAGSLDIINHFPSLNDKIIYIIDSHRPIHLNNINKHNEVVRVLDITQSIYDSINIPEPETMDGNAIVIDGYKNIDGVVVNVEKLIDIESNLVDEYHSSSYFSEPASFQVFTFAKENNLATPDTLWCAILGLTEHFELEKIDNDRYDILFDIIKKEVSRFANDQPLFITIENEDEEVIYPAGKVKVPLFVSFYISPSNELRCPLLRQWTLNDSMRASSFLASRLRLWTQKGNDYLRDLLARAGILLRDANTTYSTMLNSEIRNSIISKIDEQIDMFGLTGFVYSSFTLRRGYEPELSASDLVIALRTALSTKSSDDDTLYDQHFIKRFLDSPRLQESIENAKKRVKCIVSFGIDVMSRRQTNIINEGAYKLVVLRNATENNFPLEQTYVVELGQFLNMAIREETLDDDSIPIPLVIAVLNQTNKTYMLAAISAGSEFGAPRESKFGYYFSQAAEKTETELIYKTFDSFVCEIPVEKYPVFIEQLTILALQ